jgi:hypothetical protein
MSELVKRDRAVEGRETGTKTDCFEITNAAGEKICTVGIEFLERANSAGERLATKIEISNPKTGEQINLAELVSIPDVLIYLGDKQPLDASHFDIRKREVHSSLPKNAFDFAVLLHELGHADQMHEEKWQDLGTFARMGSVVLSPNDFEAIFSYLKISSSEDYGTLGILKPEVVTEALILLDRYREVTKALQLIEHRNDQVVRQAKQQEEKFFLDRFKVSPDEINRWVVECAKSKSESEKEAVVDQMRAAGVLIDQVEFFPEDEGSADVDLATRRQMVMDRLSKLIDRQDLEVVVDFPEEDLDLAVAQVILDIDNGRQLLLPIVIKASQAEIRDYQDQQEDLRRQNDQLSEKMGILRAKIAKIKNEDVQKWFKANLADLKEEARRPRRLEERDATRRALIWLRQLKQEFGIDLLQDIKIESQFDEDSLHCLITTTAPDELKKALSSYGATSRQMKRGKLKPELPERKQKAA